MIPLLLRVRNFMCYRDDVPPLDFEGIHLACLTGANGHGKSALLDAMTWALWGKARAKRDDELIHLGQSEMEVEFTFDLGGTVYRVLRKRDSSKRGRSVLDLQVQAPGGNGEFSSLAESGIRDTQEAIIRLLRMDYDTFTNSAFLLQGKADAFTTRTPSERKAVLSEILGLGVYDDYEERARDKARERDRQVAELDGLMRDIDRELARRPEYEVELESASTLVDSLSGAVREAEACLELLRHEQQALQHKRSLQDDLGRRLRQARQELAEIQAQIAQRRQRLQGYEAVLEERQPVEEGYAALIAAREEEAAWNEKLAAFVRLQGRQRELEGIVNAARNKLDLERGRLSERVRDLEGRAAARLALERQLAEARARLEHYAEVQISRDEDQSRAQTLAEELASLQARNEQLRAEMDVLKEKIELLRGEAAEAQCPLCGQSLSDAHRSELLSRFQSDGEALASAHRSNAARRIQARQEIEALSANVKRLEGELAGQASQQRREAQLEQSLAEAQSAGIQLETTRAELDLVEESIRTRAYAPDEQTALAGLAGELEALAYDPEAHERARGQVAALTAFSDAYQRLQTAAERVDEERAALDLLGPRQARWQDALARDQAQWESLDAEVARLPAVSAEIDANARQLEDLQRQSSRARQALGAAQQKLDHCRYLTEERVRRVADRNRVVEEKAIFDELRLAFGKRGLQAMIIEAAIPEIEWEANRLLARMTGGRMHVRFETQRETLKGDLIETLDVFISDELGTRPYELFSGGEAFRVDFAIRIALSKLLARRAGAQLRLLVIDEGFGTQDAQGRERLVEAINSIQDDFARILVITHIEELRDAFPVLIEVTKTPSGSRFSLS